MFDLYINPKCNEMRVNSIEGATNEIVVELNDRMVNKIPGNLHIFTSIDSVDDVDVIVFPQEFLNSLNISGLPQHMLKLKIHTIVISLRNMNSFRKLSA